MIRMVTCIVCGKCWNPMVPGVLYRSGDLRWMCADETACRARIQAQAAADVQAMWRALDKCWERLEREGWTWPAL